MKSSKFLVGIIFLMILVIACAPSQPSTGTNIEKAKITAPSSQQSGSQVSVSIKNFKFNPQNIVVNAGTTVVWTNEDNVAHTVENSDGTLKSDELAQGDTYKFTFTKAGKYDYNCGIHKSMHGSVTVQ